LRSYLLVIKRKATFSQRINNFRLECGACLAIALRFRDQYAEIDILRKSFQLTVGF
jgi:hypothetical protein